MAETLHPTRDLCVALLAHVDAGKTTLSEALLYKCGVIRKLGRVDHQNTNLDYDIQERERGITIYNKEARFAYQDTKFTLVDTPGHSDFSSEMERSLQVLDVAIVVVNGAEGIQAHTKMIWKLLEYYHIPTFIFVNKMDMSYLSKDHIMKELQTLSSNCLWVDSPSFHEDVAMLSEEYLSYYLENDTLSQQHLQNAVGTRSLFPVCFGSALKSEGIEEFLEILTKYAPTPVYEDTFKAIVYKKSMDDQGNRLVHCKITGGKLVVKSVLENGEKIDQIRLYNGPKYDAVNEVYAGQICALKGISNVSVGDILGSGEQQRKPLLSSYLSYQIIAVDQNDPYVVYKKLQVLAEEDPQLSLSYDTSTQEIRIRLMGEIQCEILQRSIKERLGIQVVFEKPQISYHETIKAPVEGVGHFEPLRHYAEVHVWMEPLPVGSGIQFAVDVPRDTLDINWQRLILTNLMEKEHLGVLTGSPITDMRITLIHGKAHLKHTEGGDFREATYRAVRQGLMEAESVLLEPYGSFTLTVPTTNMSRAIYDIDTREGNYEIVEGVDGNVTLQGSAPIRLLQDYQPIVASYTKGSGLFSFEFDEYRPCLHPEEILSTISYDPDRDINNQSSSVFCAHGAGYYVPWNEVKANAHLPLRETRRENAEPVRQRKYHISDEEMERVMMRTFGPNRTKLFKETPKYSDEYGKTEVKESKKACILVDGYNLIFGWDELATMAKDDLYSARIELIHRLCNYQGYKNALVVVVFDAYKVKDNPGNILKNDNIYVIYTKEAQTADSYIEKVTHDLKHHYLITVVTSDNAEQMIVIGNHAGRMSVREFVMEYEYYEKQFYLEYNEKISKSFNHSLADIRKLNEEK